MGFLHEHFYTYIETDYKSSIVKQVVIYPVIIISRGRGKGGQKPGQGE